MKAIQKEQRGKNPLVNHNLGICYYEAGDYEKASEWLRKAEGLFKGLNKDCSEVLE